MVPGRTHSNVPQRLWHSHWVFWLSALSELESWLFLTTTVKADYVTQYWLLLVAPAGTLPQQVHVQASARVI